MFSNGSLAISWNHTGSQPYAALTSTQQQNGNYPAWTTDGFAFDSFNISDSAIANATLTANVTAFSTVLDCSAIRLTPVFAPVKNRSALINGIPTLWFKLEPDATDLAAANCSTPTVLTVPTPPAAGNLAIGDSAYANELKYDAWGLRAADGSPAAAAWLNVSLCNSNPDDVRIAATVLKPNTDLTNLTALEHSTDQTPTFQVQSLLCRPQYSTQEVKLTVNASTGAVLEYSPVTSPQLIGIGISPAVLETYLNNPLDGNSQQVFTEVSNREVTTLADINPTVSFANVTEYADLYFMSFGRDPFFPIMFENDDGTLANSYFSDSSVFAADVNSLASNTMAQITNTMARQSSSNPLTGTVAYVQPRLLLRQWALRLSQACLGILAIACVLFATIFRLVSCLDKDPGTLAAAAVTLSRNPQLEDLFITKPYWTQEDLQDLFDGVICHATRCHTGGTVIDAETKGERINQSHRDQSVERAPHFRPLALHWSYVTAVALAGLAILAALAATLRKSMASPGITISTTTKEAAWSLVPTVVLLILGYTLAGLAESVNAFEPYANLRTHQQWGPQTVLFNPINHSVFSLPYRAFTRIGSIVVLWMSLIILLIPAVKVSVAGLFTATDASTLTSGSMQLDTSLMDQFESLYQLDYSIFTTVVDKASQWSEWSQISSFGLPERSGLQDNLVFSNVTGPAKNAVASITSRIPAIEVDVQCTTYGVDDFDIWTFAEVYSDELYPSFFFRCGNQRCQDGVNTTAVDMASFYQWGLAEYHTAYPNYIGQAFLPQDYNLDIYPGAPYTVMLGDYSSLAGGFRNLSTIPYTNASLREGPGHSGDPIAIRATPGMFDKALPSMRGAVCSRNISRVTVDVTLTQSVRPGLNGTSTLLPWAVSAYESSSISDKALLNTSTPGWMSPYFPNNDPATNGYGGNNDPVSRGGDEAELVSDTFWPSPGTSLNFWEQLAVYQEYQGNNLSEILDVEQLAKAVEAMYTTYSVQMLSELRSYASQVNSGTEKRSVPQEVVVQMRQRKSAMHQSLGVTAAIIAMVAAIIVLSFLAALKYLPLPGYGNRKDPLLRTAPGSIASAMSLLAGSRLVRELREQGITRVRQTDVWSNKFGLGWWEEGPVESLPEVGHFNDQLPPSESGDGKNESQPHLHGKLLPVQRRWGIDIVK